MEPKVNESTPRERLARLITLLKRTRMFWRGALVFVVLGIGISLVLALTSKRAWRSETTIVYRDAIQARTDRDLVAQRAARLGPMLKDLLYARPGLEEVVAEYNLFPIKRERRGMLEAVEEMQLAVGFRARSTDSFVISFVYEDPDIAQKVTATLAELVISQYNRQNIDAATMARDFLERELDEAKDKVDESSHALATFLVQNPQFQWGINDSPYAPTPTQGGPQGMTPIQGVPSPRVASDPVLFGLERELAVIESKLSPSSAPRAPAPAAPPSEAQKQRDEAARALAAAEAALAEKLTTVTMVHPDAIASKARVESARRRLAAAEAALAAERPRASASTALPVTLSSAERARLLERRGVLQRQIAARRVAAQAQRTPVQPSPPSKESAGHEKDNTEASIVELETEWHRLRLELERARDQLRAVEAKAHAASMSADAAQKQSQAELSILDPAYRPTRPDRGRGRVFFAGATIAIFLAIAYAALRVLLNDTLLDESDVEAIGGPPVLVSMPLLPALPKPSAEPTIIIPDVHEERASDEQEPDERPSSDTIVLEPPRAPTPVQILRAPIPLLGPALHRRRHAGVTIRFGTVPPPPPSEAQLDQAPLGPGALAIRTETSIIEAVLEDPEIEVTSAAPSANGEQIHARLRRVPPATLAALRVLRHRLEQRRALGSLVVAVLSPGEDEGKTTVALQLALTLSEAERARVVLVESNLERPGIARALGLRLSESFSLSAQIRARLDGRQRPWRVVQLGPSLSAIAEAKDGCCDPAALHSRYFQEMIATLRRNFDYVVIDGPKVLGLGDANVVEAVSDGVILLARAGATRGAELFRANRQLGEQRILGVVFNGAELTKDDARPANRAA